MFPFPWQTKRTRVKSNNFVGNSHRNNSWYTYNMFHQCKFAVWPLASCVYPLICVDYWSEGKCTFPQLSHCPASSSLPLKKKASQRLFCQLFYSCIFCLKASSISVLQFSPILSNLQYSLKSNILCVYVCVLYSCGVNWAGWN